MMTTESRRASTSRMAPTVAAPGSKRACERIPFFAQVRLSTLTGRETAVARTFDLSRLGVGLVGVNLGAIGEVVRITFILRDRSDKDIIEFTTGVFVQTHSDESATYWGIQFLEPLSQATTPTLLYRLDRC